MALVSGESMSSFAQRNATPYADLGTAPDDSDDDEYVYVSSLAEQIAHTLMLDDDEEPPSPSQPSPISFQPQLQYQGNFWPSTSLLLDQELDPTCPEMMIPVSNFAAVWRDHGPTEWDCFYTPSLQQASKQLSTLCTTQLELRRNHLPRGWNAACLANNKQAAVCASKTWDMRSQEAHSTVYNSASTARKESIGTGVFLPKIVNSGPHYRRKAGFSSSKSAYAPRHKC